MLPDAKKFVDSLPRCTHIENDTPCNNIALFVSETGKEICFAHLPKEIQEAYRKRYKGVWSHG